MCISVLSTSHPAYPFILISNRDEFISRPTLRANWWDAPNEHVLGGRDLQRSERGTWLGITSRGRIAILTNFREEGEFSIDTTKSRGAMVNSYLCVPPESTESEEEFVQRLMRDVGISDVGGFTMVFGRLRKPKHPQHSSGVVNGDSSPLPSMPGLALVSNRTENPKNLRRIATRTGETWGVSNSHFGDNSWPKVVHGEKLLNQVIQQNMTSKPEDLMERLFEILCEDALPRRKAEEEWEKYVFHMRNSIMIPPGKGEVTDADDASEGLRKVGKSSYGTSKQTVILVNWEGKVTFVERTLYDQEGMPVAESERDIRFDFTIDGWEENIPK